MSSQAQINANRTNSQSSTGPQTDAGKAKSSHNAVKSALTGQTVLLPTDDTAAYEKLSQSFIDLYRPATYQEEILVQSLIDTEWRLRRIPTLEAAFYAVGCRDFAELAPNQQDTLAAHIFLKYERQFKNLSTQENRLRRMRDKDSARLRALQAERKEAEEAAAKRAAQANPPTAEKTVPATAIALFNEAKRAAAANPNLDISQIGFDFENPPQALKQAA
jgi:hypothetical protein